MPAETPQSFRLAASAMRDPVFARAGEAALAKAMTTIRSRYESGRVPDHMYYHNCAHTAGVVARAQVIGEVMGLSEREHLLALVAAAYHDVVQRWDAVERPGGIVFRQRQVGRDEVASAHEAVEAMATLGIAFRPEEYGIVASAIVSTIPSWDPEIGTVAQPFLVAHPVVSAVGMADLGAAAMSPETFGRDGPALFAEENIDLMKAVMAAPRADDVSGADQSLYRERYLDWLDAQPAFARGRQQRLLGEEIAGFDAPMRARLTALFNRFDDSAALARQSADHARTLAFAPLMRQLDARIFPEN